MDRGIVYPGAIPLDTDQLSQNKNAMIALGVIIAAILGSSTLFDGLACTPTAPASLQILIAPGSVYALENVDSTAYGSLAADTSHQVMKQGISLSTLTLNCPAPSTTGQSINYLIQAAYQDADTGPVVLPYYNSANPSVAYNGPNNSGTSQNTVRQGQCVVAVKAGVAANTGSQTTPAPDAGYTGLWVVTVANTQTQITSGNIAMVAGAPFILEKLGDKISIPTGDARYLRIGSITGRTTLTSNTNYYVSTTGSDSNAGTSGSPWLTIQHALNYLQSNVDLAGYTATVNVADGTYTGGVIVNAPFVGGGVVQLSGNTASPANCIISTTNADGIAVVNGGSLSVRGFKVQTTTAGNGIKAGNNGSIYVNGNMNLGTCVNDHFNAILVGGYIEIDANYSISGNATSGGHWVAQESGTGIVCVGKTITLTGTPSFGSAFAFSDDGYLNVSGNTFSGGGSGQRYAAINNGVIQTGGAGSTYFPGTVSGTGTNPGTAPYGLYI